MVARLVAIASILAAASAPVFAQIGPPKAEVTAIAEYDGVQPGQTARLAVRVSVPPGVHLQSNKPRDPLLIPTVLTIDAPPGATVSEIVFPPSTDFQVIGYPEPLAVFERQFDIGVQLAIAADVAGDSLTLPARLRYQACDENMCYIPSTIAFTWTLPIAAAPKLAAGNGEVFNQIAFGRGERPGEPAAPVLQQPAAAGATGLEQLDKFTILGSTGGYLGTEDFLDFIHRAETGVKETGLFEGRGPFAILLIVFLGGLALNLTPCVLPMIPVNLAIIGAGSQAGSRSRGFLLGSTYGAAMALVYGVLGLAVILTAGTFGTINASPWFNMTIAVVFVLLALAMFDVITIDFSRLAGGSRLGDKGRGTFLLAFTMGSVAALLAGACVAPVVIQVVLFSSDLYAKGSAIALGLPFVLGLGMAVPWPIAGAGLASLPKPGMWMVRVKQVFGVLILVMAAYYGYQGYAILANRWVDPAEVASSVQEQMKSGWHGSLEEGLAVATREQKPVLIDMWATWCKNCLTMDKTTFADSQVIEALKGYVKIKFQAEDPEQEATKAVMQHFKAVGLPTYVILKPTQ